MKKRVLMIAALVSGTLAVFQDVTELKELERVKDEVVSIVSHELKLPLTTILGYGEMLAMTLDGAPRQYAGEICSQSRRLNRMIEDFLDIARLESGRQRVRRYPFPPGRMLEDAVAGGDPGGDQVEIGAAQGMRHSLMFRRKASTTPW